MPVIMRALLFVALPFMCVAEKPQYPPPKIQDCTHYFGSQTNAKDKLVSVVDPDVAGDVGGIFCRGAHKQAPCTFVHKAGPTSKCAPPTPPDKCHRYMKVTYSKCDALDTDLAGGIDTKDVFDTSDGVFKQCRGHVEKKEEVCFGPKKGESISHLPFPESYDVEKCDCDGLNEKYESGLSVVTGVPGLQFNSGMVVAALGVMVAGSVVFMAKRRYDGRCALLRESAEGEELTSMDSLLE